MITQEANLRRNFILSRVEDMKRAKASYSDFWPEAERTWKMVIVPKTGEDEWRASLPDTWGFATLKTAQAAFMKSKVVPVVIRKENDPQNKADDLRDLYISIAEKGNLDQELYYARLDTFKLGNGFTKTIYVKDTRKVWDIKKFDPKTEEFEWEEKEINDFDDPKTIRVSPYLVLKDDLARADWNTVRDLVELEVLGRDTAKRLYPDANWKEIKTSTGILDGLKAKSETQIATSNTTGTLLSDTSKPANYHFFAPGFDWNKDVTEIIHYWSKEEDSYEILINGYPHKVRTKKDPNPIPYIHKQIPYTHYMYSPYGGDEAWGAGIFEIGRAEILALKQHREMMSDRQKLSIFSPAFTDVNDEIDQRQTKVGPLDLIRTKGGVPTHWQIPGITNADLALQDKYESAYKRAVGIDERILGVQAQGIRLTATEVSFLVEAALKRLGEFLELYKNSLLHGEMKLKFSLFKQYFSSPLSAEPKTKDDTGLRSLKNEFKKFKIKIGNVYQEKEISPNFFDGEVDLDIDLQLLMPMTQSQLVTMWGQVLRDSIPLKQAGTVDVSLKKIYEKYVEALGTNINVLKEDKTRKAVDRAEAEHSLFADPNTSSKLKEIMPNGTPLEYLTEDHIMTHKDLLEEDIYIGDAEKLNLLDHIEMDVKNFEKQQPPQTPQIPPQAISGLGGLPPEQLAAARTTGSPEQPAEPQPATQSPPTINE